MDGDGSPEPSRLLKKKGNIEMENSRSKTREKIYDEYRRLGMTEEQIKAIREFDDKVEESNRNFYEHTTLMCDLKKLEKKSYAEE